MTFPRLPFDEVFADESGGNIKTPQREYKSSGEFPVVDQGKQLVAGYVDDDTRICGDGRSAIVFGDHTRYFKFVDFPFCMGADGVKVLRPKIDADLKYLYHYVRTLKIPNAGYDRHFKYLKRTEIAIPPVAEQRRIAAILDQADALRAKRREALAQLDSLTQSIFIEMFGDPSTNSKNWDASELGREALLQGGFAFKSADYVAEGVRLVKISNVHKDDLTWDEIDCLPNNYAEDYRAFALNVGDIVLALTRPIIQSLDSVKIAVVQRDDMPCLLNQRVGRFILRKGARITPQYLLGYCRSKEFFRAVKRFCSESLQPNMSTSQVDSLRIPLPPMQTQETYARRIETIELLRFSNQDSLKQIDALFTSLQHRAFRGEL